MPLLPIGVLAGAAIGRDLDQGGEVSVAVKLSLPPLALSDKVFAGTDVDGEGAGLRRSSGCGSVGRDGEILSAVAAVDLDGVDTVAAFDKVGVVAGVPDQAVVAGLAEAGRRRPRR